MLPNTVNTIRIKHKLVILVTPSLYLYLLCFKGWWFSQVMEFLPRLFLTVDNRAMIPKLILFKDKGRQHRQWLLLALSGKQNSKVSRGRCIKSLYDSGYQLVDPDPLGSNNSFTGDTIRYLLPHQIFALWFRTSARLQLSSSNKNNFMVRVIKNMKDCF